VSEKLPEEFYRASALLRLGLADLAKAELSACEKRLSGNREGLELVAQLYWRHGLYRRGVLLAERLLEGSGSVAGGEGAGDEVSAGGAVVNPGSGSESFIEKIAHPICFPDVLYAESRSQGVDPFLILSIIKKESVFEPAAVSRAGAIGLMQLMPATARAVASYLGEGEARLELTDPITNLRYGIWHFGRLVGRYSDSVVMALAAYNAGEENAERWLKGIGRGDGKVPHSADAFVYMESVSYRETRDYLHAVLADLHAYRELYRN
jgi:soluble lytic murein transglycosylase